MAHSLSAKKRVRQSAKRRARNRARKEVLKNEVKVLTAAMAKGDVKAAKEAMPKVVSELDRTAAKHTIHRKTASRRRSRLQKKLNVLAAAGK